ncbi:MAG TPA: NADH-quinone oxidoreductase subunit NuoE [Anaerolineales bacterium]|nr:NADH-quinone oxidoreductase subunit NuoE [Anaerolineales bacterium]
MLTEKHQAEIDAILAKYPPDQRRSAVMPLLYLAQREYGHLSRAAVAEVAVLLDLDPTQVGSLIGFYTLYHDEPGGKYRIQVCTDLPCALRGAEAFASELCQNLGIRLGDTTPDGMLTVETVMCLAGCDKAPLFQVQDVEGLHFHESQTTESALSLIEELRRKSEHG